MKEKMYWGMFDEKGKLMEDDYPFVYLTRKEGIEYKELLEEVNATIEKVKITKVKGEKVK